MIHENTRAGKVALSGNDIFIIPPPDHGIREAIETAFRSFGVMLQWVTPQAGGEVLSSLLADAPQDDSGASVYMVRMVPPGDTDSAADPARLKQHFAAYDGKDITLGELAIVLTQSI